jgi:hypothetical protein
MSLFWALWPSCRHLTFPAKVADLVREEILISNLKDVDHIMMSVSRVMMLKHQTREEWLEGENKR